MAMATMMEAGETTTSPTLKPKKAVRRLKGTSACCRPQGASTAAMATRKNARRNAPDRTTPSSSSEFALQADCG